MENDEDRPFILDEFKKPSIYIYVLCYAAVAMPLGYIFNSVWFSAILAMGFAYLGRILIFDKIMHSSYRKKKDNGD